MNLLEQRISDVLGLFFPELCVTCGRRLVSQETFLCFDCWEDLPVTNFHLKTDNKVAQLFWGRVDISAATAFFSYKKGSRYQQLIHFVKYKGLKELGYETGKKFGFQLLESPDFAAVDVIIPVPLHSRKAKKRGYNQSEWIARGVAEVLEKPVDTKTLHRKVFTLTQTKRNRYERWQNVETVFGLSDPKGIENKHVLLVDDVVTTGATLEACAIHLLKVPGTKVSIATLAFADI
ncbi:phosphoribosyltransferase family protein [Draconibacterium sp. IB214405]|uniref:ComF family protein n=1 Tax=Draconibacterium sp. IB214405 TaxID=3097352 RepID=UPI002A13DF78|nr:phosphoribosyltransferase family protein [Draconibacterium sp. IB214405]MDX8338109.1 phosphoribosyltransferase family protein [Draconibacterium sp. IB214405]